jgi:hypothetical protein
MNHTEAAHATGQGLSRPQPPTRWRHRASRGETENGVSNPFSNVLMAVHAGPFRQIAQRETGRLAGA